MRVSATSSCQLQGASWLAHVSFPLLQTHTHACLNFPIRHVSAQILMPEIMQSRAICLLKLFLQAESCQASAPPTPSPSKPAPKRPERPSAQDMATQTRLAPDPSIHPMNEMFANVRTQPMYPARAHNAQQVQLIFNVWFWEMVLLLRTIISR